MTETTTVPGDETGRELLAMRPPFELPENEAAFLSARIGGW